MSARTRFIAGLIFFGVIIVLWVSGIAKFLTFEQLERHMGFLQQFVASHYMLAVLSYAALYMVSTIFALPMASMLTLIAGFLFGMIPGFCYTVIFATLSALISFFIMRYLFGEYVQQKYENQLRSFNAAIKRQGIRYLLLVRFIPVIPFFVVNMVASCLPVSWSIFALTTFFGVMPVAAVYSYAGREFSHIHSFSDIFTPRILAVFLFLIGLGIVSVIVSKWRSKRR